MLKTHIIALCITAISALSACDRTKLLASNQTCLGDDDIGQFITIPAGHFTKSKQPIYPEEGAPHTVEVKGFAIQVHEVTNAQFTLFVTATAYVTDAEKYLNSDNPGAGSALFSFSDENQEGSWKLINGATWRMPNGIGSNIQGKQNYPVVHVSHNDALAYASWAGGRLPSEVEWEYAADLGIIDSDNSYPGAFDDKGTPIANTWQGLFPIMDKGIDGFEGVAPVGCFPKSDIGLSDMIGNVWEWTVTPYAKQAHTIKGGSFLCAPNFCRRYRASARQPHESNFSSNHIGFRIIKDGELQQIER